MIPREPEAALHAVATATIAQIRSITSEWRVPQNKSAPPARQNDMVDRRTDMTQALEKGVARTITFFKTLPPADLDRPVYVDDVHWTVRQVLAHFITIEKSMQWLFRNMLAGGPGSPQDFDLERFNRTQPVKLDGLSLDELIERFGAVRKGNDCDRCGYVGIRLRSHRPAPLSRDRSARTLHPLGGRACPPPRTGYPRGIESRS